MGHERVLTPSRLLLVACLRQGLRLGRDNHLTGLGWLIDAAYAYTDDSEWEPLTPPTTSTTNPGLDTAADALAAMLTAIARRQHEHSQRAADRLTAVPGQRPAARRADRDGLVLPSAKAHKDLHALNSIKRSTAGEGPAHPPWRKQTSGASSNRLCGYGVAGSAQLGPPAAP